MNIIYKFMYHQDFSRWIACITFFAAFALTWWPNQRRAWSAAVLFCVGLLARLIYLGIYYLSAVTTGGEHPTVCLVLGLWVFLYASAAVWLLYPSIPQPRAIFLSKILHLAILLPLAVLLGVGWVDNRMILSPYDLTWLLYAVLWFRIREAYV